MTRDEAIKIYAGALSVSGSHFLDGLAALGILKLDEPKGALEKFKDALVYQGWSPQGVDDALRKSGTKIVEK